MLPEFDNEMKTTRALLERVPEERADFRPHAKSTALGPLAAHIAGLPFFITSAATRDELDFSPPGGQPIRPPAFTTTKAVLELFDERVRAARAALESARDEDLVRTFTLRSGEHVIAAIPRIAAIRTLGMNHIIHHRGQLSVYLRLNDVPLPSIYGPTADT